MNSSYKLHQKITKDESKKYPTRPSTAVKFKCPHKSKNCRKRFRASEANSSQTWTNVKKEQMKVVTHLFGIAKSLQETIAGKASIDPLKAAFQGIADEQTAINKRLGQLEQRMENVKFQSWLTLTPKTQVPPPQQRSLTPLCKSSPMCPITFPHSSNLSNKKVNLLLPTSTIRTKTTTLSLTLLATPS